MIYLCLLLQEDLLPFCDLAIRTETELTAFLIFSQLFHLKNGFPFEILLKILFGICALSAAMSASAAYCCFVHLVAAAIVSKWL